MKSILIIFPMVVTCSIALFSCRQESSPLYGTYKIYSDDPDVKQWIMGENTYLQVNEDKTIVYNNTLNGKPKFHFTGNFNLDERTNTLNVHWAQGKLPNKLQVEKSGDHYLIAIGTTYYRKER